MKARISLRNKLILIFTSIFIVPLITFGSVYLLLSYNMNEIFHIESSSDFDQTIFALRDRIAKNYDKIESPRIFNKEINQYYEKISERIILMDPYYSVLFDSEDLDIIDKGIIFDEKTFYKNHRNAIEYYIDISEDDYIFIYIVPNSTFDYTLNIYKYINFISIGVGFLVLLFMVIFISRKLSNRIIKPIVLLSEVAEEISKGNLEKGIECNRNDEIGKFCRVFDTMRCYLKESIEKKEILERNRRELIAHISHDLRTPLTSIKGYVEILEDGLVKNEKKTLEYLSIIGKKTSQMEELIDNLFTFSKMNLGEYKLETEDHNVSKILHSILEDYVLEFKDSTIDFDLDIQMSNRLINVNYRGLSQVIDNLISNSKRYALKKISVSCRIYKEELTIKVYDDGKKISESDIPYIFDAFYKADKARTVDAKESGLGLAICKYVVEHFKGSIKVNNEYVGKSFIIKLPLSK